MVDFRILKKYLQIVQEAITSFVMYVSLLFFNNYAQYFKNIFDIYIIYLKWFQSHRAKII